MFQVKFQMRSQTFHENECVNRFSIRIRHSQRYLMHPIWGIITYDILRTVAVHALQILSQSVSQSVSQYNAVSAYVRPKQKYFDSSYTQTWSVHPYNNATCEEKICRDLNPFNSNRKYFKSNVKPNRDLSNRISLLQVESTNVSKLWFKSQSRFGFAYHCYFSTAT